MAHVPYVVYACTHARWRRSTIGVHPKTDFSRNLNCIPMINPMTQAYQHVIFRNNIDIPNDFGSRSPAIQKRYSGNVIPVS